MLLNYGPNLISNQKKVFGTTQYKLCSKRFRKLL